MIVPAHCYLTEHATSSEAIDCLRRDLVAGETACQQDHRLEVWQALLLTSTGRSFDHETLSSSRTEASQIRLKNRTVRPSEEFDPLSDSTPWDLFYKDEELRATISQDCERMFPEEVWFTGKETQRVIRDCLFTWCKENSDVSYKQGMHEVAGVVAWVVLHGSKKSNDHVDDDCDSLFASVMSNLKAFYVTDPRGTSPIHQHANRIQTELLAVVDPALSAHLASLQIEPQLYCMKWLRLLFSREVQFGQVLKLWDALFAADPLLDLVDYMACALLMRIRTHILGGDASTTLVTVMRYSYPAEAPVLSLVQDALHLRNNFTAVGGSEIIKRYEDGSTPNAQHLILKLDPVAPAQHVYPINSILGQTDRLGINDYVRGAVQEVKRNMSPIINETRHALARANSRGTYPVSPGGPAYLNGSSASRDRELAAILALTISNLKNGDPLDSNITKLEDVKLILQGRKSLPDLAARTPVTVDPRSFSSGSTLKVSSPPRRAVSPIRIPAIRPKHSPSDDWPRRVPDIDLSKTESDSREEIPLSLSPKRPSNQLSSNFSFLFDESDTKSTTFHKPH